MLWNLADISKLWDSSGRDFLICNSKLNIQVGIQFNVTEKKCFVSTAFTSHPTRGSLNLASSFTCRTRPWWRWEGAAAGTRSVNLSSSHGVHRFSELFQKQIKTAVCNFSFNITLLVSTYYTNGQGHVSHNFQDWRWREHKMQIQVQITNLFKCLSTIVSRCRARVWVQVMAQGRSSSTIYVKPLQHVNIYLNSIQSCFAWHTGLIPSTSSWVWYTQP